VHRDLIDTPYAEDEVHVSPAGRWVAYNADEWGRWEVYVATFPGFTSKRQISRDGGVQPQWRRDGRELFYLSGDGSMMGASGSLRARSLWVVSRRAYSTLEWIRTPTCHSTR
jgi:Tol biopolymer transport system component